MIEFPSLSVAATSGLLFLALLASPAIAQDTAGLPLASYTTEQSEAGREAYALNCRTCHGSRLNNGTFAPPLKGSAFRESFFDMPANTLFEYIVASMPPNAPGSLQNGVYADIVAYIMQENGLNPGDEELPSDVADLQMLQLPSTPSE
jgi:mono/diheme cytochrome c family protein